MTIPELKNLILTQELDDKLEEFLLELTSGQETVTKELLENIASILALQSEFYHESSKVLIEESKIYDSFSKNPERVNQETLTKALQTFSDNQKKLKAIIDSKTKQAKINQVD